MDKDLNPKIIADNLVVSLAYTLTVDGKVVDSSEEDDPIIFLQGFGNIIQGLERELYGLVVDDTKQIVVKPEDGYGDFNQDAVLEVPRKEFPSDIPPEVGLEIQVTDDNGEVLDATIARIDKEIIVLDFNHPLAGKTLQFDVKVIEVREASAEELEHGHVHSDDFDEEDNEFDEFEDYDGEDQDKEDEEEDKEVVDKDEKK